MKENRISYLDNLKIFLVCLVIFHHSAHAYGNINGTWIYSNAERCDSLYYIILVNSSFFMGLFFMISGYFIPHSFRKRSLIDFSINKAKRLLLPVILILTVIVPIYFYIVSIYIDGNNYGFFDYYFNIYWKGGKFSYEHGWFIVHLFFYSIIYAILRTLLKKKRFKINRKFNIGNVFLVAIIIGCIFMIVRTDYEQDRWIALFGVIGMEPAHLAQYIIFFAIGILSYHNDWFSEITKKQGQLFIILGVIMAFMVYFNKVIPEKLWNFIYSNWSFYESFIGIFISFALIYVFKTYFNKTNKLLQKLSKCSYGVYVIHTMVVVIMQVLLDTVKAMPITKCIIVTLSSICISFLFIYLYKSGINAVTRRYRLHDARANVLNQ